MRGTLASVRGNRNSCHNAALQSSHPHHEELIKVRGEDGQEFDSLEQRNLGVFREFQHPLVEGEPAQLAVKITLLRKISCLWRTFVVVVFSRIDPVVAGRAKPVSVDGMLETLEEILSDCFYGKLTPALRQASALASVVRAGS